MCCRAPLFGYVVVGVAATWFGFWWFAAFSVLSILVATAFAARARQYWPIIHPRYSLFYVLPALLIALTLIFNRPIEWGQWLGWSVAATLVVTTILTLAYRRHIDRDWAVVSTFSVILSFVAFSFDALNTRMPGQDCSAQFAVVLSKYPGGYRQGGPRVTVSTDGGERTFFVGWRTYSAASSGDPMCVLEFDGALSWRWSTLSACTDNQIERIVSEG